MKNVFITLRSLTVIVISAIITAAIITTGLIGCSKGPELPVYISGLTIDPEEITMEVGEERTITATISPSNATNKTITWETNNAAVATVDDGLVIGISQGTATITARSPEGLFADCQITVIGDEFIPVESLAGIPEKILINVPFSLNIVIVVPDHATNKEIEWEIIDDGNTGAGIIDGDLIAASPGTITIQAVIKNGLEEDDDFIIEEEIEVVDDFVAVESITGIAETGIVGNPVALNTATVEPSDATFKTITWALGSGSTAPGANVTGTATNRSAVATDAGTVVVTATITDGAAVGTPFTQDFIITFSRIPVTDITGVATTGSFGTALNLNAGATVVPSNATNRTITWAVTNVGSTGATITGNSLTVTAPGAVTVTATIVNGIADGNFTKDFTINFAHVPVTGINFRSGTAIIGQNFNLNSDDDGITMVVPSNASFKTIAWTVNSADGTITDGNLNATRTGMVDVTATIANGTAMGTPYTQVIPVAVNPIPVTNITGVPAITVRDVPIAINATVLPATATNRDIVWSIDNAESTAAASFSGNILTATTTGNIRIRATITQGTNLTTDYVQEFSSEVIDALVPVTDITLIGDNSASASVGAANLHLLADITPNNSTYRNIIWSIVESQTATESEATITGGNFLRLTKTGNYSFQVRATVMYGGTSGADFTRDFNITLEKTSPPLKEFVATIFPYFFLFRNNNTEPLVGFSSNSNPATTQLEFNINDDQTFIYKLPPFVTGLLDENGEVVHKHLNNEYNFILVAIPTDAVNPNKKIPALTQVVLYNSSSTVKKTITSAHEDMPIGLVDSSGLWWLDAGTIGTENPVTVPSASLNLVYFQEANLDLMSFRIPSELFTEDNTDLLPGDYLEFTIVVGTGSP